MKLQITGNDHNFNVPLPTRLLFSKVMLGILCKSTGAGGIQETVPSHAANVLAREMKRIQKEHGSWLLLEVQSVNGEEIKIYL